MLPLQKEKHRCNKILTGRKGKYGRMRREGGAQGREGVRRGKGEGVGEGGTGLSDWFKRTCQASGHPAGLMGAVCSRRTRGPLAPCRAARGAPQQRSYPGACALAFVCGRAVGPPIPQGSRPPVPLSPLRLQRSRPQVPLQKASAPAGLAPPAARVNHGLGPGVADA